MISGSFPGQLQVFVGREDGTFAKAETIKQADGTEYAFKASVPYAVDWENDGDLDLVVGDIEGRVYLILNASGDKTLALGASSRLMAGDAEIKVPGGDAGPVVTDWDGDGRVDLLVGCGDGRVLFYRNTAARGAPTFADAETLVNRSKAYPSGDEGDCSPCGSRTKVAVADWNADGEADLLVGDFAMAKPEPRELTDEEKKTLETLKANHQVLMPKYSEAMQDTQRKVFEEFGIDDPANIPADKQAALQEAMMKALQAEPCKSLMADMQETMQTIGKLEGRPTPKGNVWVFLRQ